MILHGGSLLGSTDALLQTGYANGSWNGNGIDSSIAAAQTLTTLGITQPVTPTAFDGENVGTADVVVKYTYYGDANLDGVVDGSDYSRIDNAVLNDLTGWYNGDFNNDGVINGSDYTLLDNAYNTQGSPLAEVALAAARSQWSYVSSVFSEGSDFLATRRRKQNFFSRQELVLPTAD